MLTKAGPGIRFNEHIEGDGPTVFAHACKMGLEGIVSKRKESTYRSGRLPDWLKMKNLAASAVVPARRAAAASEPKAPPCPLTVRAHHGARPCWRKSTC